MCRRHPITGPAFTSASTAAAAGAAPISPIRLRPGSFKTSGGLVGGTLGYNWQVGQAVFGLEGDIDWSNIRGSAFCGGVTSCETKNDWLGTVRGRLGYAFDRFMPYVTGGLAVGDIKTSIAGSAARTTPRPVGHSAAA